MANENRFAAWLKDWIDNHHAWDARKLAETMDVSESVISKWKKGLNLPDAMMLMRLAQATGEDHWHLAHLAYDWPAVPPTDDLMKEPGVRDLSRTYVELARMDEEMADDLGALAKTLLRQAHKKRGRDS